MTPRHFTSVTLSELRTRLSEIIQRVALDSEHTIINRFGKPIVVLVPYAWYKEKNPNVDGPCDCECGQ